MSYPLARKAQAPPDFATEDRPNVDASAKPASSGGKVQPTVQQRQRPIAQRRAVM
jgi:hypothetical protein